MSRRWLGTPGSATFLEPATQLATLVRALPVNGILLATLAQDAFDDPHAPDRDRLLGRVAARVLAAHEAVREGADDLEQVKAAADTWTSAAGWRAAWATAGVLCDSLSSTVLALNVLVAHEGPAGIVLAAAAATGEPVWLTARALPTGWVLPVGR